MFGRLRGRFALLPAWVNHGSVYNKPFPNREVSIMEWSETFDRKMDGETRKGKNERRGNKSGKEKRFGRVVE